MINKNAWLATLVALACGTSAQADFFSQLVTVKESAAGGPGPNVTLVRQFNGSGNGGSSYGNYFSNDATPQVGGQVRIVGADKLTFYNRLGAPATPNVNFGANQVVGVYALTATVTAVTAQGINAIITAGGLRFYASAGTGSFDPRIPTTWGATDAGGNLLATNLSQYMLVAPQNILEGVPGTASLGIPVPANQVNLTAASQLLPLPNALVLFREISDTGGFTTVTTSAIPPGFVPGPEALFAAVTEANIGPGATLAGILAGFSAADKAAFNNIFNGLTGGLGNFANFGTGTAQDYLPNGNPLANGDAAFSSGANALPGLLADTVIPEPASLVLCGMFLACMGAYRGLRRQRQQVALAC